MARAPLLQLTDMTLTFGGDPLLDDISLTVHDGDRAALVGRNGSGKSTLMKVMAGLVEADGGTRALSPGISVGYMEQDPDFAGFATLGDFATSGLETGQDHRILKAAQGLGFDPDLSPETASGGERRRAALAKLMAESPELMLLDEPTNHLDIQAIGWLEEQLRASRGAYVLISHDRAFLRALTRVTLWMDRGVMRRQDKGFDAFEAWRDTVWAEEDLARHKLDRKIKAEARWAVEGISARRKRNQGRVRALLDMKAERAAQIRRQGTAAMQLESGERSGRKVIETRGISKSYGDNLILRDLSVTLSRKDRLAFVGPNGVGKTTLLRLLMKTEAPDTGSVKHGTNLIPAVFDQSRAALDPEMSLWDALTVERDLSVSGRSDQVMVRGQPQHVVGYLKDFLFDEAQARGPVKSLSGGEKARLLLAKLMAKESNLLVLDEPTNDLDIESLDLLQELLDDYDGTVLLVSHDRDFLDRVATQTLSFDGGGRVTLYAGGWSDMQGQRDDVPSAEKKVKKPAQQAEKKREKPPVSGLTFSEKHRFERLPDEIDTLGAEISKLEGVLSDAELFTRDPRTFEKASAALVDRQEKLVEAEDEWLALAEKSEGG
ncbi:MAG: ATP-binding cassette domain-containing protein [Pseudomonadota bacterium]